MWLLSRRPHTDPPGVSASLLLEEESHSGCCRAMEDTAPVTSIFVKGLTENVTKEHLHDAFAQFGEIRNGLSGISLKPARDNRDPIAFVTFLSAESVPGAVAGPVYLDDQQVALPTYLASSHIHCPSPMAPVYCSLLTIVKCSCSCGNRAMHLWAIKCLSA